MRSHMRGGASRMVGRTRRISCGSFSRLSAKVTGMPQRIGSSSITTRCAMCAEGRNATVESCRAERQHGRDPYRDWPRSPGA